MHVPHIGRRVSSAVAASALVALVAVTPALAKPGFNAALKMTSRGATCTANLNVSYIVKGSPIDQIQYTASAGLPTPFGGYLNWFTPTVKATSTVPVTFASGTSISFHLVASLTGATVATADTNVLACP